MLRCLVTGAGGFIGSTLVERLLALGHTVTGIDCFAPYYPSAIKRSNLSCAVKNARFTLHELNLTASELEPYVNGFDVVYHLAGQPGIRHSWAEGFNAYLGNNLLATHRLLNALTPPYPRTLVYASSSSVYGTSHRPMRETDLPIPRSPYGVTKLAAEHLCIAYGREKHFRVIALRYFTVYGPRQRPDMAFARFITAASSGLPLQLHGGGAMMRDFTYVDDVVQANILAATGNAPPGPYNISGGRSVKVAEAVAAIANLLHCQVTTNSTVAQPGEVEITSADLALATAQLGYIPQMSLDRGLKMQIEWHQNEFQRIRDLTVNSLSESARMTK